MMKKKIYIPQLLEMPEGYPIVTWYSMHGSVQYGYLPRSSFYGSLVLSASELALSHLSPIGQRWLWSRCFARARTCATWCIYGSIYALSCLKHKGSVQKRRFVHQENRSTSSSFPKMALEIFKQYLFLLCDYLAAAAAAGCSLQGRRNWGCYSTPNFFQLSIEALIIAPPFFLWVQYRWAPEIIHTFRCPWYPFLVSSTH